MNSFTREKILVVDDQPVNVQLLKRKLEREGLQVATAHSGQEALDVVARARPSLILLDVMMPDMDGIEVCRRLQAAECTRAIPVIFVTARGAREHKIEGLSMGAVDYITKPVDLDEMVARVRTQLRLISINREMADLQKRLAEARRAALIGAVTQGIEHNLNNMLAVVLGYVDLMKLQYNRPELVKSNATNVESAVKRIAGVIKQLNQLVVRTRPPVTRVSLQTLIGNSIARYQDAFGITAPVAVSNPLGEMEVDVHVESFEDILGKLLINAWESYGFPGADVDGASARPITLTVSPAKLAQGGDAFRISVEDQGRGISPEIRDHMFEPFVSTKQNVGVGMGLSIARHTLRTLGGDLIMSDREGGGTVATLICPVRQEE
ncbi:response regulator [Ereboglobus luteus]|uniref:histidine kinase n=1 Tax=Ereboglobus luteus TaxID=1796921 RepID=A0A2U8E308_9BACT|nr:response regulator [Ereboglobus luteus]AWI09175.1 hybrid sensor histidine kinase/response regulator [Ereboglobus luteus]